MVKKKAIDITDEQKVAVLKRNRKLACKAFAKDSCEMYQEEFVSLIRGLFNYSPSTYGGDILRSWERVYRTIAKYQD